MALPAEPEKINHGQRGARDSANQGEKELPPEFTRRSRRIGKPNGRHTEDTVQKAIETVAIAIPTGQNVKRVVGIADGWVTVFDQAFGHKVAPLSILDVDVAWPREDQHGQNKQPQPAEREAPSEAADCCRHIARGVHGRFSGASKLPACTY